jgi:hypothetical protein
VIQNLNKYCKPDEILALLTQYNLNKEQISLSEFEIFFVENSYLISSLERVIYIPYLYFKVKPPNKEIERICIEITTKGEKDLSKYIKSILMTESEFYVIDANFWNVWTKSVGWAENETSIPSKEGAKSAEYKARPKIDLTNLLDYSWKLKQGLIYKKDFYLINKK